MPFRISLRYGDFSICHEDEMDTLAAMKSGVYVSAMNITSAKMVQLMESRLLSEDPDYDHDAALLADQTKKTTVEAEGDSEEPESGTAGEGEAEQG